MATIPPWILALVKMAISIGSPYLLDLLRKWFTKLPAEVVEIINDLIKGLLDPTVNNRVAKKAAAFKLKRCTGVACKPEIKKD